MKPCRDRGNFVSPLRKMLLIFLLVTYPQISIAGRSEKTANIILWDTQSPFASTIDVRNKAGWKAVPANLLALELNPSAAVSDPAYYGREYFFEGDAVVENRYLTAVFFSKEGKLLVYSKTNPGLKTVEFVPLRLKAKSAGIDCCSILHHTDDQLVLEVSFSDEGPRNVCSAIFSFDKSQIIEIKPAESMKGMSILSPIEYGLIPDFIADDLIYDPQKYPSMKMLNIPSENLFLGLLRGRNNMLVVTWLVGDRQMRLVLGKNEQNRLIESVDFDNDGRSIYLALLDAPGIWHREDLEPAYLEKDVQVDWKRPFSAKWITQLYEADIKTTFTFKESRENIWRGITGRYNYPVWFDGEKTFFRLSKKIPPKEYSLIYSLERDNTPASIFAPVDIIKATLGRQTSDNILDLTGRRLRTHHRRAGLGVRRAATCGCTEAILPVFEAGQEVDKKEYVEGAVDDMVYFVTRHVERINEYMVFANNMIRYLDEAGKSDAGLKPFIDNMKIVILQIPQEYERQKENMKDLKYAAELSRRTKALTKNKSPKNLSAYKDLSEKWRAMGGSQDSVIAKCHSITRKLSQQAGYECVDQPRAVEIAREIRKRCRQCLRNPDGYEIWPNY
ncbi:MAG: hypothetical protein JW837_13540 [Sedimentisphaerales bacterium]|nr:hypothetical protein [Sedimentisphaerales bacterium]